MTAAVPNLLVLLPDRRRGRNLEPMLAGGKFEVHRAPTAHSVEVLARYLAFDLIVVGYPLAAMSIADLAGRLRRGGSASARTPLLVLAEPADVAETRRELRSNVRVESAETPSDELRAVLGELLGIARRAPARVLVRLRAAGDGRESVARVCQTQNISTSGMLVRTKRPPPVGTRVRVELSLPDDPQPIRADAEVVRHTEPRSETASGFGVRFLSFDREGSDRLRAHVRRRAG